MGWHVVTQTEVFELLCSTIALVSEVMLLISLLFVTSGLRQQTAYLSWNKACKPFSCTLCWVSEAMPSSAMLWYLSHLNFHMCIGSIGGNVSTRYQQVLLYSNMVWGCNIEWWMQGRLNIYNQSLALSQSPYYAVSASGLTKDSSVTKQSTCKASTATGWFHDKTASTLMCLPAVSAAVVAVKPCLYFFMLAIQASMPSIQAWSGQLLSASTIFYIG